MEEGMHPTISTIYKVFLPCQFPQRLKNIRPGSHQRCFWATWAKWDILDFCIEIPHLSHPYPSHQDLNLRIINFFCLNSLPERIKQINKLNICYWLHVILDISNFKTDMCVVLGEIMEVVVAPHHRSYKLICCGEHITNHITSFEMCSCREELVQIFFECDFVSLQWILRN